MKRRLNLGRKDWLALAILGVISLVMRLAIVPYGLPLFEDSDDQFVLHQSVKIADLAGPASSFGLPDSTLFYGYGLLLRGVFEVRQVAGKETAVSVTAANDAGEPWIVETIRIINILVVWLTVVMLYAVTKRLANRQAAVIAALLLTFSWMTIEHVWPIRPDLLTALIAVGIVWSCLEISEQPTRRRYLIAGTILGLGVATKYPLILLVFPLVAAHVQAWRRREIRWSDRRVWTDRHLWLAAAGSLLVFSLATPLFWPFLGEVISDIRHEARSVHPGADGLSFFGNLRFYLTGVWQQGIGTVAAVIAIIGGLVAARRQPIMTVLVASFPLALVIGLSFHGLHWDRWMIPVLPFIALGAGISLAWLRRHPRVPGWVGLAVLIVAIVPPMIRSLRVAQSFRSPETRQLARDWFVTNTFDQSRTISETYTPVLLTAKTSQTFVENIGLRRDLDYQTDGIDYFVTNADRRDLFYSLPTTFPVFITYYQNTLEQSQLLYRAAVPAAESLARLVAVPDWTIWRHPWPLTARRGPAIEIYGFSERAKGK